MLPAFVCTLRQALFALYIFAVNDVKWLLAASCFHMVKGHHAVLIHHALALTVCKHKEHLSSGKMDTKL